MLCVFSRVLYIVFDSYLNICSSVKGRFIYFCRANRRFVFNLFSHFIRTFVSLILSRIIMLYFNYVMHKYCSCFKIIHRSVICLVFVHFFFFLFFILVSFPFISYCSFLLGLRPLCSSILRPKLPHHWAQFGPKHQCKA